MQISIAQAQLFFLALTRVLAILIHVPVLAGPSIPNQVKIGLGVLVAMIVLPWKPLGPEVESLPAFAFGMGVLRELVVGTLAGFAATLTFATFGVAGEVMGLTSGFSAGHLINPVLGTTGSAIDQFFQITVMLIFIVLNGHHTFLLGLQRTFEVIPLNGPLPDLTAEQLMRMTAEMVIAGIQLSLPVMSAVLLADLALGLLARVAPQVQVFFLGVPMKIGVGLIALSLAMTVFLPRLSNMFRLVGQQMVNLLGGLP
ncbi:MAG: flagellar biosynthetic protein FliR [Chloroflexi bacterium]|nr:MAG: flagellar biosynthetic protein FliR [Chloroflexota bacterium]